MQRCSFDGTRPQLGGIYIRNRNDAIRFNYGLMKGLQKLASEPESLSAKKREMSR